MDVEVDSEQELCLEDVEQEGLEILKEFLKKLKSLWVDFGIDDNRKAKRTKVVWGHVRNLLEEIFDEESYFYQTLTSRITDFTQQINGLSSSLGVPTIDASGSLVQREEQLRLELDRLNKIKHFRLKNVNHLKAAESRYCKVMGLSVQPYSQKNDLPTESELEELKRRVAALKAEKDRRHKKFHLVKKDLTTILEETELETDTSFEKAILSGKEESFLSDDTFKALEEAIYKAEKKKEELRNRKEKLLRELMDLWEKLHLDDLTKASFIAAHIDCNVSVIKSIETELKRCEQMWEERIVKEYDNLKRELHDLWSKCCVSEDAKRAFVDLPPTEVTEEVIQSYKNEIEKWENHYHLVKHIMDRIKERENLWNELIEFESKANDPNRFKNKNWNMLQEERERRRLQKDLPGLEEVIFLLIESYESQNNCSFLYRGKDYREHVNKQWSSRLNEKENKKIERRLSSQFKSEVDSATPGKRHPLTTPKRTPKQTIQSASKLASFHTPLSTFNPTPNKSVRSATPMPCVRATPKSTGKFTPKREKLFLLSCPKCGQKKDNNLFKRHQCYEFNKESLNSTTYSEFVEKLNSADSNNLQSSSLMKRTVLTPKPNQPVPNNSRYFTPNQRTPGSSLRATPKLTPIRGKLGLPFLL